MAAPTAPAAGTFRACLREPLNWLLAAVPLAVGLEVFHAAPLWTFLASCVAVVPLAGLMGRATENLAETMGPGPGGLLNATFGNAAELIIALIVLSKGPEKFELVKASLTGSVIGNVLLVLGLAIVCGGLRHKEQVFNRTAASMGATLLALSTIGLIIPTIFFYLVAPSGHPDVAGARRVEHISEEIAIILAVTYVLSLVFTLRTHRHLFADPEAAGAEPGREPEWGRRTALLVLAGATALIAVISEFLVGALDGARAALGMTELFVGVIVVAVIGNAAEHSTAVVMALKNKMDLAVNIAVGSGIQIALFVAPVLVLASVLMGHQPILDLHFTLLEVIAVVVAISVLALVSHDGETHWMEGIMLLAVYLMLAFAFYHLPERKAAVKTQGHAPAKAVARSGPHQMRRMHPGDSARSNFVCGRLPPRLEQNSRLPAPGRSPAWPSPTTHTPLPPGRTARRRNRTPPFSPSAAATACCARSAGGPSERSGRPRPPGASRSP
jgi:Ca2+:H+ antiporter